MRIPTLIALTLSALAPFAVAQPDASSIGSTDGSKVAYPIAAGESPKLVFLTILGEGEGLDQLREASPNLEIISVRSRAEAMELARAHGVDGRLASAEFIEAAPNLVWVQSTSAGVDRYITIEPLMETDRIVLTNMRAVHGPTIADHSFAMLLTLTRNMRVHERNRAEGTWGSPDARRGIALEGRTMFVVGLGGIGSEIAQRAAGFGMNVIASRRSERPTPEYIDYVGKPDELLEMLGRADVVAIALPLTDETRGQFGAEAFAAMKDGAYLINIARGPIVDTDAMMAALDSGKLAGACLDVTDPEPLPEGHALWGYENVVITPHTAGSAELTSERWWALYRENVRRFGAGEPLLNTVDKAAGY
ncbi:MAG: D-2-hydroxyacid dehydrogenase [Planctomycetota bacterium]|nr:MAG: D-2-hydroxyacid dehydrogenase [Planctomycetota bacterium]